MSKTLYLSKTDRLLFNFSKLIPLTYIRLVIGTIPENTKSILDLGCGSGDFMKIINSDNNYKVDGVDIFPEYVENARKIGVYERVFNRDILKFDNNKKYDVVFMAHIIEHFTKEEGIRLLNKVEKFARKRIIVITPNGEYEQGEYDYNPYQKHKSAWEVGDFDKLDYKVNGQGWKFLYRNSYVGKLGYLFYLLYVFSTLTQPLLRIRPDKALQLICYKDV